MLLAEVCCSAAGHGWRRCRLGSVGGVGVPWAIGTVDFSAPSGRLTVSLLQSNVAQDDKFAVDCTAALA
jgi:hypothetical protein